MWLCLGGRVNQTKGRLHYAPFISNVHSFVPSDVAREIQAAGPRCTAVLCCAVPRKGGGGGRRCVVDSLWWRGSTGGQVVHSSSLPDGLLELRAVL